MKKFAIMATAAGILAGCAFTAQAKQGCGVRDLAGEGYYPKSGIVVGVDYKADIVTVSDCRQDLWQFKGCEDWLVGDDVAMIMYDNDTENIYDDKVVMAVYENYG